MTDEQVKGIARAINPHWWNDDIDLLDFTRAVLARAKAQDEAIMRQALDALENHTAIKHPQQIYYRDSAITALRERLGETK